MEPEPPFQGYALPTSSTTYTPNQFFDVVLPNGSRGVVRLVSYMIRKTLGWSDQDGNPQEPQVHFSYRQLEQEAGIGHSMIRRAIDDAVAARYIRCIQAGTVNTPGTLGTPALYELNWDERGEYITSPEEFNGFFAGNGNLTYIPNDFFDYTIPNETLALVRVVGAIIRYTIGFQTHFGFRRQKIAMSLTEIQNKTGIKGRQHVVQALKEAIEGNHIVRLEMGFFDPEAGKESYPAVYGIKWLSSENGRENSRQDSDTPKRLPGIGREYTPKRLPEDTPKKLPERTEKVTGEYSEKVTDIEITRNNTSINNNSKGSQLSEPASVAVAQIFSSSSTILTTIQDRLKTAGFDEATALRIARDHPESVIRQQIAYLPQRKPSRNPLGMLRRAIEENWPPPALPLPDLMMEPSATENAQSPAHEFATYFYAGWAGNTGRSATRPSANDLADATPFIQMLLDHSSDVSLIPDWGREFGAYARKKEQDNPKVVRSLTYALRAHGDAFYLVWQERRRQKILQARAAARNAHQERYQEKYRDYLRQREDDIRGESPDAYALFLQEEEKQRAKYHTGMFAKSKIAQRLQETHDREEERLERFRAFFRKATPPRVFDFWEWDEKVHENRFQAGEVA